MKKMFLYFFISLGVLTVVVFCIRFFSPEDAWICKDGVWLKHGNPSEPKPIEKCEMASSISDIKEQKRDCDSVCNDNLIDVCGKDNKTYKCEEQAKCNNVEVLYKGECGTMNSASCALSDFASREECKMIMQNRLIFENYIRENISKLSPQKEVLGGKFYVTKFAWADENNGVVDYEDGHIAFMAKFYIAFDGGQIKISFFEIMK